MRSKQILLQLLFLLCISTSIVGYRITGIPQQLGHHKSIRKLKLQTNSKPTITHLKLRTFSHVATLDDPFVPASLLPNNNLLSLLIGCATIMVGYSGYVKNPLSGIFQSIWGKHKKETHDSSQITEPKVMGPADWGACSLEKVDVLNDDYTLFKFRVAQHNLLPPSGLGVGRKILLCSSNAKGNPVKQSLYPISSPFSKSTFEVVIPTSSTHSEDFNMHNILSKLSLGDEVAFKLGKNRLKYQGSDTSIQCLTMIASGTGVIPLVQLLRRIFMSNTYNIDRCELLWINSKKEDFVLNNEIEKFETDHGDKFVCARVLDAALDSPEYEINQNIQESLPSFETGRVALISAPHQTSAKFIKLLEENLQYPTSDVVRLD